MTSKKPRTVEYRRRREQKTDYQKRLKLLFFGKPRLVVRMTNQKLIAQLVEFKEAGDVVITGADSFALKEKGWTHSFKNIPACYLFGLLIGKKGLEKKVDEAVLDTGMVTPHKKGKLYAFLKGVLDSGMKIPHGASEIFPEEKALTGVNITDYFKSKGKEMNIKKSFEDSKKKIGG
ncbi:50S ribosomal protein L18 [Candidatus Woesearchaeota archaeon]|nr:50S ribosomal protein L18 [Candidatus Woesearchaeota archaeon]